ncbi:MAG: alanine racemase [Bacteroidales bacterium]|nr:alanine racemase [Bacteroidales bacterium]
MKSDGFSRLELSKSACIHNYRYFRSRLLPSTKLLVLVKANAYGHGAVEMAALLQQAGADYLAVALPVEGMELRKAGVTLPVLVLTAGSDFFPEIIEHRLEPGIPNLDTLKALCSVLKERGISNFPVHIKLDTGMHRLGFMSSEIKELTGFLKSNPPVKVVSIYSHLAVADMPCPEQDAHTLEQVEMFRRNASAIEDALGYHPLWHILNTAGIERFPQFQFDMCRLGIGIYGIDPVPGSERGLVPVASLKCKVLQIKRLQEGDGAIGYGRHGKVAGGGTVIATIPVGYADGINRHLGCGKAAFFLNGHKVPTIGNICMDMCMLDVTGIEAKVGDTVTIFGQEPTVNELAEILDTIPYEILTSVPRRIERIIVK